MYRGFLILASFLTNCGDMKAANTLFEQLSVPPPLSNTTIPNDKAAALNGSEAVKPVAPASGVDLMTANALFSSRPGRCRSFAEYCLPRIGSDYRNFYRCDNLCNAFLALGGAAILANTSMDMNFRNWYQRDIADSLSGGELDRLNVMSKSFGERLMVPLFAIPAVGYRFFQQVDSGDVRRQSVFGEYTARTTRAYLLGVPTLWLGQYILGAERPGSGSSHWHGFGDMNGISGHALIGSIPFMTAAQMTDNYWLKGVFYTFSTFAGWSRIQDDAHFLSQVMLGWYFGYLSVRAVSKTEGVPLMKGLTLFPVFEGNAVGFGFHFRR